MEQYLETLNNLIPLLAIGSLAVFMTIEILIPYFEQGAGRRRQRWRNVGMIGTAFLLNAVLGGLLVMPFLWSDRNNFGILHRQLGQSPLAIVIGMLLIDLSGYTLHITFHKVPQLWRIHRVHHSDTKLDASSGLRLHPFELLILLGSQGIVLSLIGVSTASVVFYNLLALPWFVVNHSNIKFPAWFERWGSLLMATPNWHRVHHSSYQPETDSHYGCLLSVWDRMFGTTRKADIEAIRFGLESLREPADQTVWSLLKMPFYRMSR